MGCGASRTAPTWVASPDLVWYYGSAGTDEKHGPCTLEEVREALSASTAGNTALVWKQGFASWMPSGLLPELGIVNGRSTTYSWAYVPFIHAVIQSGDTAMTESAARLAKHDYQWDALVRDYGSRLSRVAPEVLQPGHVNQTNRASGLSSLPWPYIPAAPLSDEPADPSTMSWPMLSRGEGAGVDNGGGALGAGSSTEKLFYTQEGLLSESPVLFAKLQEMVRRIEASLQKSGFDVKGKSVEFIAA